MSISNTDFYYVFLAFLTCIFLLLSTLFPTFLCGASTIKNSSFLITIFPVLPQDLCISSISRSTSLYTLDFYMSFCILIEISPLALTHSRPFKLDLFLYSHPGLHSSCRLDMLSLRYVTYVITVLNVNLLNVIMMIIILSKYVLIIEK